MEAGGELRLGSNEGLRPKLSNAMPGWLGADMMFARGLRGSTKLGQEPGTEQWPRLSWAACIIALRRQLEASMRLNHLDFFMTKLCACDELLEQQAFGLAATSSGVVRIQSRILMVGVLLMLVSS